MEKLTYTIGDGEVAQIHEILALLERLASFEIPQRRCPEELWTGDAKLLKQWAAGGLPDAVVKVAVGEDKTLLGVSFAQLRPEALSEKPGAHLEVLVVSKSAEGQGVGRALMEETERAVGALGAETMTLNVFMVNAKARGLYRHLGYEEELLRCIKTL